MSPGLINFPLGKSFFGFQFWFLNLHLSFYKHEVEADSSSYNNHMITEAVICFSWGSFDLSCLQFLVLCVFCSKSLYFLIVSPLTILLNLRVSDLQLKDIIVSLLGKLLMVERENLLFLYLLLPRILSCAFFFPFK